MRQFMIDMMAGMMPFMMLLVWLGLALIAIGILALLARLFSGGALASRAAFWSGTLLLVLAAFFLLSQVAGMLLGASPAINLGDATRYEFNLKPFWMVGLVFLVPSVLILALRERGR